MYVAARTRSPELSVRTAQCIKYRQVLPPRVCRMSTVPETSLNELGLRITRANRQREHTLLYLRFHGIDETLEAHLRRSLERVTSKLWGPATLSHRGNGEYALFLESWSVGRALQLAALLERAAVQGFNRLGRNIWMEVGTLPVQDCTNADDVLTRAARSCGSMM